MRIGNKIHAIKIQFKATEKIERFVYVYIIEGKKLYLVDTGVSGCSKVIEKYIESIGRNISEIGGILLTHSHPDHIGGLHEIRQRMNCFVYSSKEERRWVEDIDLQFKERPMPKFYELVGGSVKVDRELFDGEIINIEEGVSIRVISTPGHSDGSISFFYEQEKALFIGDAIHTIENINMPIYTDFEALINSISKIEKVQKIEYLLSAWDIPRRKDEAYKIIETGKELLLNIQKSVEKFYEKKEYLENMEIFSKKVFGDTGIKNAIIVPLVVKSIESNIENIKKRIRIKEELVLLSKTLKSRGFKVEICENQKSAIELLNTIIGKSEIVNSIGFGNSATIKNMGLYDILSKYSENIYIHAPVGTAEIDRKALTADYYLTSTNAISLDGHIVNIDGTGNRTAATCFGPKSLIYLIGRNKITKTLDEAMSRAKYSAVQLAKKFNRKTPCVVTGKCEDCISPECICAVTTIHRKKPYGIDITIILINEDLGL